MGKGERRPRQACRRPGPQKPPRRRIANRRQIRSHRDTLIDAAILDGVDPEASLTDTDSVARIPDHKINRIDALLPSERPVTAVRPRCYVSFTE